MWEPGGLKASQPLLRRVCWAVGLRAARQATAILPVVPVLQTTVAAGALAPSIATPTALALPLAQAVQQHFPQVKFHLDGIRILSFMYI